MGRKERENRELEQFEGGRTQGFGCDGSKLDTESEVEFRIGEGFVVQGFCWVLRSSSEEGTSEAGKGRRKLK
ncbi:unnamed protein product [Linum trigynum]|uniref:Uncharacterized protein n=1 Tax=Linum trigynum TaxID=586398 RepID=A0AAV2GHX1_9ROSI